MDRSNEWDEYADIYTDKQLSGTDLNIEKVLPAAVSLLPESLSGLCVLDLCCGRGALTKVLLERGARVMAVDFSSRLLAQAGQYVGKRDDVRFVRNDVCASGPAWDVPFDWVVSNMSLQDIHDFRAALANVRSAMRPGGMLVVSFRHPFTDGWCDNYLTEQVITNPLQRKWRGESRSAVYPKLYHRPLGYYISVLSELGFAIDHFHELADNAEKPILLAVLIRARLFPNESSRDAVECAGR